jgi:hypothetical protein
MSIPLQTRFGRGFVYRALLVAAVALAASLSTKAQQDSPGAETYKKIRALAGDWQGSFEWSGARTDRGKMDATYYVTGNGSAVVENLLMNGQPVMTSVYHMDGKDLRLTHFCAAQNQPRLKAQRVDLPHSEVDFGFVDATNMSSPDAPHVRGLEWRMVDVDHIRLTFLFAAGSKQSRELIQLTRVENKSHAAP